MFRAGDPTAANAVDARATLGPKWQEALPNWYVFLMLVVSCFVFQS
jgi:hypothetical protein